MCSTLNNRKKLKQSSITDLVIASKLFRNIHKPTLFILVLANVRSFCNIELPNFKSKVGYICF